jgi:AGCS family alanine or glycine:cation symporter
MATKYAEAVCAVHYREKDSAGHFIGGPMYYIKNGLGRSWHWLAWLFAFFGTIAGFGIGNTVQANSVATVLKSDFNVEPYITGIALSVLVFLVIIGGVKRIAHVAGSLVPLMAISYLVIGLAVLLANIEAVPAAIALVVNSAFTGTAATGGFAGAAVWAAMRWGIARGIFSNEAGLGSAPIAHAAAKTSNPVRQGLIAMLGTFFDTIIICSVTGLVIVVTGVWSSGETGASLSSLAFSQGFSGGNYVVSIGLPIFAFTTMLGWSYYGERCVQYLLGDKSILPFRLFWVAAIYLGSVAELNFVWLLADTLNALMALPNLIALFLLSPVVFALTREYFARQK